MAVDAHELRACITNPELVYAQHGEYEGCEARVAGRILIIADPEDRNVVTVLWHLEDASARNNLQLSRDRRVPA
jgi:hypothetical protein